MREKMYNYSHKKALVSWALCRNEKNEIKLRNVIYDS